jgi:hypothetical protein
MSQTTEKIREFIRPLFEHVIWGAKSGYGTFMVFNGGKLVPNSPEMSKKALERGEWHFWAYFCGWRISRNGVIIVGSGDSKDAMYRLIPMLDGRKILNVEIREKTFDTKFLFEGEVSLELFSLSSPKNETEQWFLFCPGDPVLSIGPGFTWFFEANREHGKPGALDDEPNQSTNGFEVKKGEKENTIREIIRPFFNNKIWGTECDENTLLMFNAGRAISKILPEGTPIGEWHFWCLSGCGWRLLRDDEFLAGSMDTVDGLLESTATILDGRAIIDFTIDPKTFDGIFFFDDGVRLEFFSVAEEDYQWRLSTPDKKILTIGPGFAWDYRDDPNPDWEEDAIKPQTPDRA